MNDKKEYAWYPEFTHVVDDENIFNTEEEAISHAQELYDAKSGVYADDDYRDDPLINVGTVERFNMEGAVNSVMENFGDELFDHIGDFAFGTGLSPEVYNKKYKEFAEKATKLLMPLVKEYIDVYPTFKVVPFEKRYNLRTKQWDTDRELRKESAE